MLYFGQLMGNSGFYRLHYKICTKLIENRFYIHHHENNWHIQRGALCRLINVSTDLDNYQNNSHYNKKLMIVQ